VLPAVTTGQSATVSPQQHLDVIKFTLDYVDGRVPVIAGAGSNCTRESIEMIENVQKIAPVAVLCVTGYYNNPPQEGLLKHYRTLSSETGAKIVIYNVPGRTGVNLKAETTVRLANDCQNIIAIKEASGNLEQVDEIIKNKPRSFDVISGDDALTFPMISCGAVGVISVIGNALPKEFSKMIRLQMKGEYDPARKIHHRFIDLFSLLFVDGNPAGVKAMLHEMGYIENVLRLPLVPTRISTLQRMSEIMKELKI
jgi:4-hydroxy-tetrahydrodipicolinate synthase